MTYFTFLKSSHSWNSWQNNYFFFLQNMLISQNLIFNLNLMFYLMSHIPTSTNFSCKWHVVANYLRIWTSLAKYYRNLVSYYFFSDTGFPKIYHMFRKVKFNKVWLKILQFRQWPEDSGSRSKIPVLGLNRQK